MTVISYRNNHFNTSKAAVRQADFEEERMESASFLQWINRCLFCIIILAVAMNVLWSVKENGIRLDIQNQEKQILSLEEKNAELKTELSQVNAPVNVEKMIAGYGLVKEAQPQYFSIKENTAPLSFNASNNPEN